jgi:isopentenyl diphosphate isomerase/L-lactate dehydrogenase-like FMN-dependent dehydrogenase
MNAEKRPGDSNHITREYFDSLLIEMRHIDAVLPDTRFTLYGETFSTPVMTAALSHLNNCHPDGVVELARGAKLANAVMWTGMGEEDELERICATGAKTIKIVKPELDDERVLSRIAHAEACGCIAVGMDVDHSYNWRGERDDVGGIAMRGITLDDIKRYVKATKLPFIIKGVLSVQDTIKCIEAGVQGIVVSHHHGIMDYAVPPLLILPKIVEAIKKHHPSKDKMPIFVDCAVANGYDVFKSIALGAVAASAGRSLMGPLTDKGAEGVSESIKWMTSQVAAAMARTCCADITQIDASLIHTL